MSQGLASRTTASAQGIDAIRVLVVDDSSVIRGIVSRWIEAAAETTLFGSAVNGQDALERVKTDKPDIIILDIEMPGMDGITALPLLLKACPQAKIIMASTLTRRNAEISLKALALGAADYVPKPTSLGGGEAAEDFRRELFARITALGGKRLRRAPAPAPRPAPTAEAAPRAAVPQVPPVVSPTSRAETPSTPVKPGPLPIRSSHVAVSTDDASVPARAAIQLDCGAGVTLVELAHVSVQIDAGDQRHLGGRAGRTGGRRTRGGACKCPPQRRDERRVERRDGDGRDERGPQPEPQPRGSRCRRPQYAAPLAATRATARATARAATGSAAVTNPEREKAIPRVVSCGSKGKSLLSSLKAKSSGMVHPTHPSPKQDHRPRARKPPPEFAGADCDHALKIRDM